MMWSSNVGGRRAGDLSSVSCLTGPLQSRISPLTGNNGCAMDFRAYLVLVIYELVN